MSFGQVLQRVRQTSIEAYANQELPFEQLIEAVNPQRNLAYHPLIQVMFDLQNDFSNSWNLPDLQVEPISIPQKTAKFDLYLSFKEISHELQCTINYNNDLFNANSISLIAECFYSLAEKVTTTPDIPISFFSSTFLFNDETSMLMVDKSRAKNFLTDITSSQLNSAHIDIDTKQSDRENYFLDHTLESQLVRIWEQVLNVKHIGLDDNFFDSGGHSLLAVKLIAQIHIQTGNHLPVATVFARPTIREIAQHIKYEYHRHTWQSLVTVQGNGKNKPVFFIHPVSGEIDYVYKLAPYFDKNQPIYGLQAQGLNGIDTPMLTIEEMASYYVQLITSQQPEGPFHLAGYSLGGIIAHEMAVILTNMRKEVKLLAMLDTYPHKPGKFTYLHMPVSAVIYSCWNFLMDSNFTLLEKWKISSKEIPFFMTHILRKYKKTFTKEYSSVRPLEEKINPRQRLTAIGSNAYSMYSMKPYSGKILFFRAVESSAKYVNNYDFGWKKYAKQGVDIYDLPNNHKSLFKDLSVCKNIAEVLQKYL